MAILKIPCMFGLLISVASLSSPGADIEDIAAFCEQSPNSEICFSGSQDDALQLIQRNVRMIPKNRKALENVSEEVVIRLEQSANAIANTINATSGADSAQEGTPAEHLMEILDTSVRDAEHLMEILDTSAEHLMENLDTSVRELMSASPNAVDNGVTFLVGLRFDLVVMLVILMFFWWFKRQYPIMFHGNVNTGMAPKGDHIASHEGLFGWLRASWSLTFDDVWRSAGLDHAQLLQYLSMNINIFAWIGLPLFFCVGPLNYFFGGNYAGADHLSWFSMGNVRPGQPWLYYVYALVTWYVVIVSTRFMHVEMRAYIPRRYQFLKEMDETRANTLRMEGIPEKYQSDEACLEFWNRLMPGGRIKEVHIAKDTKTCGLKSNYAAKVDAEEKLEKAKAQWEKSDRSEDSKPMMKESMFGANVETIPYLEKYIKEETAKIADERKRILTEAKQNVGGVNMAHGFVTFKNRQDAELALHLDLSADGDQWILEYAPEPKDVIWADMTQDPKAEIGRYIIGCLLVFLMFATAGGETVWAVNIATHYNIAPQSIKASQFPSFMFNFFTDLASGAFPMICKYCFSWFDTTASELQASHWYFCCILVYILIAALGNNFGSFTETLHSDPLGIFKVIASAIPSCEHIFMNFLCFNWYWQFTALARTINIFQYMGNYGESNEEERRAMSEPEDQDYYAFKFQSARWAFYVAIGLILGTLSPPLDLLVCALMIILRSVYGYLFCFAYTKKSDSGGAFFVKMIGYNFISLHVYMILMLAVYYYRAPNLIPTVIAACAWVYLFFSQRRFLHYKWQHLPFPELTEAAETKAIKRLTEVADTKAIDKIPKLVLTYEQPELRD